MCEENHTCARSTDDFFCFVYDEVPANPLNAPRVRERQTDREGEQERKRGRDRELERERASERERARARSERERERVEDPSTGTARHTLER